MVFVEQFLALLGKEDLVPLAKFTIGYVLLARLLKYFSRTVQLHSIVHCAVTSIWTGVALYRVTRGDIFSLYMYDVMQNIDPSETWVLTITAFHSIGYFVGDTIDIFIDYSNKKRQIYVLHHLASICGLFTIYWGSFIAVVGLWVLELGGLVHHIKHAAMVYEVPRPLYIAAEVLYHSVYLSSRIYLFCAVSYGLYVFGDSKSPWIDLICFSTVYFLVAQNLYWWCLNVKMLIYPRKEAAVGNSAGHAGSAIGASGGDRIGHVRKGQ